jgi:MOSC domain-containing protein YiiM
VRHCSPWRKLSWKAAVDWSAIATTTTTERSRKLKDSGDWELTLIESEEIHRFNESQGLSLPPTSFRRNIVTSGIRLNELVGRRFKVGSAILEGMRLCEPCAHLGKLVGPAIVKGMVHKAGLRARIVTGSIVRVGDPIDPSV